MVGFSAQARHAMPCVFARERHPLSVPGVKKFPKALCLRQARLRQTAGGIMQTACMQLCAEAMAKSDVTCYHCTPIACMLTQLPVCTVRMCSVG